MTQASRFQVGDKVILGKHQADPNGKYWDNWCSDMDRYVGKVATITRVHGVDRADGSGSPLYYVDIDGSMWHWREINMTPLYPYQAPTEATSATTYGAKCTKCQAYNEYVPASDSFICYGCRN